MKMKKMVFVEALREGRGKARGGDGSHRARGPRILAVAPRSQCLPTALCRSVPRVSRPAPSCATACSRTPTSPGSARPRVSRPRTEGCRRNAPAPPRAPRYRPHFPPPSPSSSSSCPQRSRRSLMVTVDASSLR